MGFGFGQRRGGQLPVEITSFVGRAEELALIRTALARFRLVTLVGPGGVGKSRTALRAAGGSAGQPRNRRSASPRANGPREADGPARVRQPTGGAWAASSARGVPVRWQTRQSSTICAPIDL